LLGLLAVATYQDYSTVGDIVDKEVSSLSALYRDVSAYPQPIRSQLQNALREYARYTIGEGWKEQRNGVLPKGADAITKTLLAFEPTTEHEKIIHTETAKELNSAGRDCQILAAACRQYCGGWSLSARF
jgi:hypothetical protein